MAAAAFGTFLTTFAVAINNHSAGGRLRRDRAVRRRAHLVRRRARGCGISRWPDSSRAFAAANELPALSLCALLGAALLWKAPRQTLLAFVPAALVVAAASFGTNWIAHDSLRPPYMHRSPTDPADNWYDYTYVRNGKLRDSYWRNPVGIDRGEPSAAALRAARHGRPPRHLLAHAGLAAERLGAGAAVAAAAGCASWPR